MSGELIWMSNASKAIAKAGTVGEAKAIGDRAAAIRLFAKKQNWAIEERGEISAIEIRAVARMGELLRETPKNKGAKGSKVTGSKREPVTDSTPTLALSGISKKQSSQAQKIASLPKRDVEKYIAENKAKDKLSVNGLARLAKRGESAAKLAEWKAKPAAEKVTATVNLIVADPPWRYDDAWSESRAIENHYPTASINEIKRHFADPKMPKVASDCILLLWATAPKLTEALEVMASWGFTYRTHAVWDKQKIGMGYWFRGQHELLLVGVTGKPGTPDESARVSSVFSEARGRHSAKPSCVYEWIERAFPMHSKLEMYCRSPRDGWQVFGNEA